MSNLVGSRERELESMETIGFVASALFDVSAEKIGRLRAAFDKNKMFYDDIAGLYQSVKQTAFERGELPQKSGAVRTVSVAFTSNKRFYGSVNAEVILAFIDQMKATPESDYLVIGRTGRALLESTEHRDQASYYAFEDDEPTGEEIRQFLKNVASYEQVHMFYPSFVNVFTHTVAIKDIMYAPHVGGAAGVETKFEYIFEPELPKILDFFETKVRYLLFQRAMLESELARTAARLFSMNQAQDHANEEITHLRRSIRRDRANFNDLRLLESFSAISRWKK